MKAGIKYVGLVAFTCAATQLGCTDDPALAGSGNAGASGSAGQGGAPPVNEYAERDSSELFDWSTIPHFRFELPAERWAYLQAHAEDEQEEPASVEFEGKPVGRSAIRFKGAYGTLYACVGDDGELLCPKLSMKLEFDEYDDEQRFFGMKELNLHSMVRDPTKLHERIAYGLYRAMDIVAPRSSWATLEVNGENFGLFSMVEEVDGRFTDNRWQEFGDGNLYKEAWPNRSDRGYFDDKLRTNEDAPDHSGLLAFAAALTTDLEDRSAAAGQHVDLEYLARYLAVDDALVNWDGITGFYCGDTSSGPCWNHNYYWYQEPARPQFWLIPWDLDGTFSPSNPFGLVPRWDTAPAECDKRYIVFGAEKVQAPNCDPLLQTVAQNRTLYEAAVRQLLEGPFQEAALHEQIDREAAFIAAAVIADPRGPGESGWRAAVDSFKADISLLRMRLERLRDREPIQQFTLSPTALNDFESADDLAVRLGIRTDSNSTTTARHYLDRSSGSAALQLDFEYRNQAPPPDGAWEQWINMALGFGGTAVDTSSLGGVRLVLTSDQPRIVRLDLESPEHLAANEGIRFGWDVPVDDKPVVVELRFADAALPSWARATGDQLELVRKQVTGLVFHPIAEGRTSQGYFPDGVTDQGSLRIDDIVLFSE